MSYNPKIYQRIKEAANKGVLFEMRMFGGAGFLLNGNMCFGVYKEFMILRLGAEEASRALKKAHVKEFDITGRPMKGWVMVSSKGFRTKKQLTGWIDHAVKFVTTLPAK